MRKAKSGGMAPLVRLKIATAGRKTWNFPCSGLLFSLQTLKLCSTDKCRGPSASLLCLVISCRSLHDPRLCKVACLNIESHHRNVEIQGETGGGVISNTLLSQTERGICCRLGPHPRAQTCG